MEAQEQIDRFREFVERNYLTILTDNIRKNKKFLVIEFNELSKFNIELAELLLEQPEDTITAAELAIEQLDIDDSKNTKVRFNNLPESQKIMIKDIRSMHLKKLFQVEGVIRQKSDVRPQVTAAKFECPSCLPKGTLVLTPQGYKPIEEVKEVISLDEDFRPIITKANVIHIGNKQIWNINNKIQCSGEHKWFVYQNGITQVIQTKHLKRGDIFYKINNGNLHNMQERIHSHLSQKRWNNTNSQKNDMFPRMQKEILQFIPKGRGKNKIRQQRDNQIIYPRKEIINPNSTYIRHKSQINKKKIDKIQNSIKECKRTMQDKPTQFNYLQAWKAMWRKRLSKVSKKISPLEMHQMWENQRKFSKKGFSSSPYKQESSRPQIRKFDGSLSITPFKITLVNKKTKNIEMFDIIVPRYNNFIIFDGIVTHNCGNILNVLQLDSAFREPSKCGCGRKGKFHEVSRELVDAQGLVLEEDPEQLEGGHQPKRMNIFLKDDLVSPISEQKTAPGSKIKIVGIIKDAPIILKTGAKSTKLDLLIEANYMESIEETFYELEISKEEEERIIELSEEIDLRQKLIDSVAPSIYGYDRIKEAILLQMVGGVHKTRKDGVQSRGDIHALLVGDPGSAKSALLKRANIIAPKSRYVSGKGVSSVGLTASVIRDEFLKGWSLEAGAMVLASNGLINIDELTQMAPEDKSALHEAMENQTVSISKANIQATLVAKTTVLAAANPKFGRFDPYGIIAEQIDLPPALINRFDLIFTIKDIPDRQRDDELATHMLTLQEDIAAKEPPIDTPFLKKYIGYAKRKIKPKLTKDAIKEIKRYYLKMRDSISGEGKIIAIPISPRQLEALVRLSEANARIRLSKDVTIDDAQKAISLLEYCLKDVAFDYETGKIDIDKIATGTPSSQRSDIIIIKSIIRRLKDRFNNVIPIDDIVADAKSQGVDEDKIELLIQKMKTVGDIYEPRNGFIGILGEL